MHKTKDLERVHDSGPTERAPKGAGSNPNPAAGPMTERANPYEMIGGEDGIRRLTRRFYALMDELPEAAACRAVHPQSLVESEQKLFEFLSGWMGGPPLFTQKRGPPMLRRRHFPARIGPDEVDGWLLCFNRAWLETVSNPELSAFILPKIDALARHMQNTE